MADLKTVEDVYVFGLELDESVIAQAKRVIASVKGGLVEAGQIVASEFTDLVDGFSSRSGQSLESSQREIESMVQQDLERAFSRDENALQQYRSLLEGHVAVHRRLLDSARQHFVAFYDEIKLEFKMAEANARTTGASGVGEQASVKLKDNLKKSGEFAKKLGVKIDFLSLGGLKGRILRSGEQVIEDRRGAYGVIGAGIGIADLSNLGYDVESEINAYLDGVRDMRVDFPSLGNQLVNVAKSLAQQLPAERMQELFKSVEDVRRLAFFTGETMDEAAREYTELRRRFGRSRDDAIKDSRLFTELGDLYIQVTGSNISLQEFRDRIIELAVMGVRYDVGIEEAANTVFRFARDLGNGVISLENLMAFMVGYVRGGPEKMAAVGDLVLSSVQGDAEFSELVRLLKPFQDDKVALSRLIETIATRSQEGQREFGLKMSSGEAERMSQQLHRAILSAVEKDTPKSLKTTSQRRHWQEQVFARLGMSDFNLPIEQRRHLLTGTDQPAMGGRADELQQLAKRQVENTKDWRDLIDENQDLTESIIAQLNALIDKYAQRGVDWRRHLGGHSRIAEMMRSVSKEELAAYLGTDLSEATYQSMLKQLPAADATHRFRRWEMSLSTGGFSDDKLESDLRDAIEEKSGL